MTNGYFDASAPPPEEPAAPLRDLQDEVLTQELQQLVDHLNDKMAVLRVEQQDVALTPEELEGILAVCGPADARLEFRSLKDRVDRGQTTWAEIWNNLEQHGQTGVDLMMAVMAWTAQAVPRWQAEAMEQVEAEARERDRAREDPPTSGGRGPADGPPLRGPGS